MLHRAVRLINRQQESLAEEDIAQQVLFFFLEFLGSSEMATRRSHFAYAIAREVKRHIFEWAKRESRKAALLDHADAEAERFHRSRRLTSSAMRCCGTSCIGA